MALKFVSTNVSGGGSGGAGTYDHNLLLNRDLLNQHPISAITGLDTILTKKYEKPVAGIPKSDLAFTIVEPSEFQAEQLRLQSVTNEVINARGGLGSLKTYIDTVASESRSAVGYPLYDVFTPELNQTVFTLSRNYRMGTRQLEVYVDGIRMLQDYDYVEESENSVRFLIDLTANNRIVCMVPSIISIGLHEEYRSTEDQTVFTTTAPYSFGLNRLLVYRNGSLQRRGTDYNEVDEYTIEFTRPMREGEYITLHQT